MQVKNTVTPIMLSQLPAMNTLFILFCQEMEFIRQTPRWTYVWIGFEGIRVDTMLKNCVFSKKQYK